MFLLGMGSYYFINVNLLSGNITGPSPVIENTNTYTEAINKTDLSLCNNIDDESMRDSCIKIIQGKINFINSNENNLSTSSSNNAE